MTNENKKQLALFGLFGGAVLLLNKPKTAVRYTQGSGTLTNVQLAQLYKELVGDVLRVFINPTDENDPQTGTPWAVDLAGYTKNYAAVKAEYQKYYGGDMTQDLIKWFTPAELSEYVAALWDKQKQAMS